MSGNGGLAGDDDARPDDARTDGASGAPEAGERPPEGGDAAGPGTDGRTEGSSTPATQQIGRIALVVLALLFVFFAVANAQPVDFSWVFGETQVREVGGEQRGGVPLIVLLTLAFLIGAAMGAIATRLSTRRRRG